MSRRALFPLHTVVCPVDLSRASRTALHQAASFAALDGAKLLVVFVADRRAAEEASGGDPGGSLEREIRDELERFAETSVTSGPTPECIVRIGSATEDILATARERKADLIVMGTHGHTGYRKLLFGSTTERVLRSTPVPVLVVPPAETEIVSIEPTGPAFRVGRVLAPVDLEAYEPADLETAAECARRFRTPLVLMYVVSPGFIVGRLRDRVEHHRAVRVREAEARLKEMAAELDAGTRVEVVVRVGTPWDEIAATAREHDVGLTVMGLRRPGGARGARPGSIAYRVLSDAPSLVLALPPVEGGRRVSP